MNAMNYNSTPVSAVQNYMICVLAWFSAMCSSDYRNQSDMTILTSTKSRTCCSGSLLSSPSPTCQASLLWRTRAKLSSATAEDGVCWNWKLLCSVLECNGGAVHVKAHTICYLQQSALHCRLINTAITVHYSGTGSNVVSDQHAYWIIAMYVVWKNFSVQQYMKLIQ